MGFIRLFNKKNNKNVEAQNLISFARVSSINYFMPLVEEFPELKVIVESNLLSKFDDLIATAGICSAMFQLPQVFNPRETQEYIIEINNELKKWNPKNSMLSVNFGRYINSLSSENKINSLEDLSEAIGTWIIFELIENNPFLGELENFREINFVLGTMVTNQFINYWKKN